MIVPSLNLWKNSCITNFCNILLRRLYRDCCRFQSNYGRRSWKAFRKCCQGTVPSKRKNTVLETFQIWLRVDKGRQIFKVLFTHFTDFIFNAMFTGTSFIWKHMFSVNIPFWKKSPQIIHCMFWWEPSLSKLVTSGFHFVCMLQSLNA